MGAVTVTEVCYLAYTPPVGELENSSGALLEVVFDLEQVGCQFGVLIEAYVILLELEIPTYRLASD